MGGKPSTFFANFSVLCEQYKNIIFYARKNPDLFEDSELLRIVVRNYLEDCWWKTDFLTKELSGMSWVWCVHKLHPKDYAEFLKRRHEPIYDKDLTEYLVKACIRQKEFCNKIQIPVLNKQNLKKWKRFYKGFLALCRRNPTKIIVPSLAQDFIWHSHMQDSESYHKDVMMKVGRFLDHLDDIEPALLQKYKKETHFIKKKIQYREADDANPSACAAPLTVAGCVAESNCGGGGCGGCGNNVSGGCGNAAGACGGGGGGGDNGGGGGGCGGGGGGDNGGGGGSACGGGGGGDNGGGGGSACGGGGGASACGGGGGGSTCGGGGSTCGGGGGGE